MYFNALAICGTLTSSINRTVCSAPRVCFASLGKEEKGVVKGCFGRGAVGVVCMEVMLEQFPFEERWAALETPRLSEIQLILVLVEPKTSSFCSPEG